MSGSKVPDVALAWQGKRKRLSKKALVSDPSALSALDNGLTGKILKVAVKGNLMVKYWQPRV